MKDVLAALIGQQIPGGCEQCADPYQTVVRHPTGSWILTVHHDDDCPFLANYQRR